MNIVIFEWPHCLQSAFAMTVFPPKFQTPVSHDLDNKFNTLPGQNIKSSIIVVKAEIWYLEQFWGSDFKSGVRKLIAKATFKLFEF